MENINIGINEQIITGRKYRRLIDKAAKLWQRYSWWTKASDVEFDDGKTAEQKVGNINGITSDLDDNRDDIAASIASVNVVDGKFGGLRFGRDENGKPGIIEIGEDGADTVIPFKKNNKFEIDNDDDDPYGNLALIQVNLTDGTATKNAYFKLPTLDVKNISFRWEKTYYCAFRIEAISPDNSIKTIFSDLTRGTRDGNFTYNLESKYKYLYFAFSQLGSSGASNWRIYDLAMEN